jgi:trans-aconitate methyltransferase
MPSRVVIPEILDHLPATDPAAQRSRRDLRRINFLMGNERWVCRVLHRFPEIVGRGIVEIGAGDGQLCRKMNDLFPQASVTAYDLAPRPVDLDSRVSWQQGDLFATSPPDAGGVRVANLFLHHFEGESLSNLWFSVSRIAPNSPTCLAD